MLMNKKKCNPLEQNESTIKYTNQLSETMPTARCDRRMKQAYARTNLPSKYALGEKVYVHLHGKG